MEIMPAPRANFEMLPQLINKKVLLVGKVSTHALLGNVKACRLDTLVDVRALSMLSGCHLSRPTTLVQIESASGMEARVKTADGGTVTVALAKPPAFQSDFVEFEGIVNTPTTFTEIDRASFGNKFGTSPNNISL
jgi:hypothetical protein